MATAAPLLFVPLHAHSAGLHEIKEIECKVLCLNRDGTLKLQLLLEYLSISPVIRCTSSASTSGEYFANILKDYQQSHVSAFNRKLKSLFWSDNKKIFFKPPLNGIPLVLNDDINISNLDTTPITSILLNISFYATCTIPYTPGDPARIVHINTSCSNTTVCCGLCLQCLTCGHKCSIANLNIDLIRMMRNFVHLTPQEFTNINAVFYTDPAAVLSKEWKINIRKLVLLLKTICSLLSLGKCQMNCRNCCRLDNIVNHDMAIYLREFFPGYTELYKYRQELHEMKMEQDIQHIIDKANITHIKIDGANEEIEKILTSLNETKSSIDKIESKQENAVNETTLLHLTFKVNTSRSMIRELKTGSSEIYKEMQREVLNKTKESVNTELRNLGEESQCTVYLNKFNFSEKYNTIKKIAYKLLCTPKYLNTVIKIKGSNIPECFQSIERKELDGFCQQLATLFQTLLVEQFPQAKVRYVPPPEISSILVGLEIESGVHKNIIYSTLHSLLQHKEIKNFLLQYSLSCHEIIHLVNEDKSAQLKEIEMAADMLDIQFAIQGLDDSKLDIHNLIENVLPFHVSTIFQDLLLKYTAFVRQDSIETLKLEAEYVRFQSDIIFYIKELQKYDVEGQYSEGELQDVNPSKSETLSSLLDIDSVSYSDEYQKHLLKKEMARGIEAKLCSRLAELESIETNVSTAHKEVQDADKEQKFKELALFLMHTSEDLQNTFGRKLMEIQIQDPIELAFQNIRSKKNKRQPGTNKGTKQSLQSDKFSKASQVQESKLRKMDKTLKDAEVRLKKEKKYNLHEVINFQEVQESKFS